jgi:hypothetical protein
MALPSRAGRSPETGLSQLAHVEVATVKRMIEETSRVKTIMLDVPEWPGHCSRQYVDVRLTDESGHQTSCLAVRRLRGVE